MIAGCHPTSSPRGCVRASPPAGMSPPNTHPTPSPGPPTRRDRSATSFQTGKHSPARLTRSTPARAGSRPCTRTIAARIARAWHSAIAAGDRVELSYRLRRRDGAWRDVMAHGAALRDGDQVREWVGVCVDVTAGRQAEAALQAERGALAVPRPAGAGHAQPDRRETRDGDHGAPAGRASWRDTLRLRRRRSRRQPVHGPQRLVAARRAQQRGRLCAGPVRAPGERPSCAGASTWWCATSMPNWATTAAAACSTRSASRPSSAPAWSRMAGCAR